jgi:hypothetical protein
MSNRLTFSPEAYIRRMQISSKTVFVFIEGKSDRYFCARLCRKAYTPETYEIATMQELPVSAPGKPGLLEWLSFLSQKGALCSRFKDKKTVAVFLADKDIDDLLKALVISPHLIYTTTYSIENHLFLHGSLAESLAASAMLDPEDVHKAIGDQVAWTRAAALSWREWAHLCVFTQKHPARCQVNFSRPSQIHADAYAPTDHVLKKQLLDEMRAAAQMDEAVFDKHLSEVEAMVDQRFAEGRHHEVFNGKWLVRFAAVTAHTVAAGRPYDSHRLPDQLIQTLALTADLDEPGWTAKTIERMRALLTCEAA